MSTALNTISILIANIVTRLIGVAALFITRRLLGPAKTGLWNLIQMVSGYAVSVNTGVEAGAEREIPYWHGKGDLGQETLVRSQMFSSALVESMISAVVLAIFATLTRNHYRHDIILGMYCAAAYLILWRVSGCYLIALRTTRNFVLLGKSQMLFALFDFIIGVGLVYQFHLTGQCIAFGLGMLARIAYYQHLIQRKTLFLFHWHFKWSTLKPLLALGFPLFIGGFFWQLLTSVDTLVVAKFCGLTALGYYSIGLSAGRSVAELPSVVSTVVFPQMIMDYGRADDAEQLGKGLYRNLESVIFFLGPVILTGFYFLFPLAVRHYLKQFEPGVPAVKILIISGFLISLTHFPSQLLTTQRKVILSSVLLFCASGVTLGSAWLCAKRGIWYVAVAVSVSYGIYLTVLLLYSFYTTLGPRRSWRAYFKLAGGLLYIALVIGIIDHVLRAPPYSPFLIDLKMAILQMSVALLCFLPMFWKAEHDLGILAKLRILWTERI